ncbi:hypothetical protein, partial [Paenibacillus dendritiformis]|uniref:hypothetical protein n=1 Tax=Paenibacillus dendritiformis TaxID=130049 RepID=UPI001B2FF339
MKKTAAGLAAEERRGSESSICARRAYSKPWHPERFQSIFSRDEIHHIKMKWRKSPWTSQRPD